MKLIKEEEERNQEKYFLMFIGVWFILNGFYLIIFGVATFKLNCLITYLVLMAYFFTYVIAVNSGSMILAIIVVFVIGATLIIIFIVKYKDIDPFAYFTFYGLAFSAFGLLITNIVFVATEAEIELLPIILLSLCLFFFLLGFFLAACVFERTEDVDDDYIKRKWITRHILTSFLGSYLFVRGFFLIASTEYYPSDFNMADFNCSKVHVKKGSIYAGIIAFIFVLTALAYCI